MNNTTNTASIINETIMRLNRCGSAQTAEINRPYHGVLRFVSYNARSDASCDCSILEITTHSMERMMQRRHSAKLFTLLSEELTWKFISALAEEARRVGDVGIEIVKTKVPTTSGTACITLERGKLPVLTTWYQ